MALQYITKGSLSDHCPILLMESSLPLTGSNNSRRLRFDHSWLANPLFREFVHDAWDSICQSIDNPNPLLKFGKRIKRLRHEIITWGTVNKSSYVREVADLQNHIRAFDLLEETSDGVGLSELDYKHRCTLKMELDRLLQLEESYWWVKSRTNWKDKGDRNTKYFHTLVNYRRKRNCIEKLEMESGPISSRADIASAFQGFYKNLFQEPVLSGVDVDFDSLQSQEQLGNLDCSCFSDEEV